MAIMNSLGSSATRKDVRKGTVSQSKIRGGYQTGRDLKKIEKININQVTSNNIN
jgi:hypothetical protein